MHYSILHNEAKLAEHFLPYQLAWIGIEDGIHALRKQAVALAEKSVRIGWTYADGFKNVRKRILHRDRDYLFATKDYPSALEYVRQCYKFAEIFDLTRSIISHGEENLRLNKVDEQGRPLAFTEDVKIGVIKFDNGSRIIAFSANPQAMAVYGGDVGLDEFAKHPNARLLWETAQGRVAWNFDLAVWSSHNGQDTVFNQFAQEARAACTAKVIPVCFLQPGDAAVLLEGSVPKPPSPNSALSTPTPNSSLKSPRLIPWNIYFRVALPDAIEFGLVNVINRARGTAIAPEQFQADCRARAITEEVFQQSYMCNPMGADSATIVDWSAIERCRADYQIERVHLEADQVRERFGEFSTTGKNEREGRITAFLRSSFPSLLDPERAPHSTRKLLQGGEPATNKKLRLGFDVAASSQGDLAVIYIDEARGSELWLVGLFTCRTEDWHFLKTVLFYFMHKLRRINGAGDETGLGRQICWEAAKTWGGRFLSVNFAGAKHDLGFALMNQLSIAQKRFPRSAQDIAADYFALRKVHTGTRWTFTEGPNSSNAASHCDIAWAGALASHAHAKRHCEIHVMVPYPHGYTDLDGFHPFGSDKVLPREYARLWSDDPSIWRRWI